MNAEVERHMEIDSGLIDKVRNIRSEMNVEAKKAVAVRIATNGSGMSESAFGRRVTTFSSWRR